MDPPEVSLETEADLSKYRVDGKGESESDHVPIDPDLSYVDTDYVHNLIGMF